jgi:cyclohexyl-isocyanide hydratase
VQLQLEYALAPPFRSGTPGEASLQVLARARDRLGAPAPLVRRSFSA